MNGNTCDDADRAEGRRINHASAFLRHPPTQQLLPDADLPTDRRDRATSVDHQGGHGSITPVRLGVALPLGTHQGILPDQIHDLARSGCPPDGVNPIGTFAGEDDASRVIARVWLAVQRVVGVAVEPVLVEPTATGLVSALAGMTPIIGLSERWQSEGLGSLRHHLAQSTPGALVSRYGPRPGLLATPAFSTRFAWSVAST